MKNSLEKATESFFIKLLKADPRLNRNQFFHFDEEKKAKSSAIVVQARQGNHNLAGPGGFDLEVSAEYRSPGKTTQATNDLISAALHEAVYQSSVSASAMQTMRKNSGLSHIVIKDEVTGDRQNSNDLRKRTVSFPVQAGLA